MHGEGKEIWPDHSIYEGTYKDGQKHGHGKITWEQSSFEGMFENDQFHGEGHYKWKDGNEF